MRNEDKICPVCGEHEFKEQGWFEICPICDWSDDLVQRHNPDMTGDNNISLNKYREKWKQGLIHRKKPFPDEAE
jgi:uncharacterized Zn finger protein (UPF0148 family)